MASLAEARAALAAFANEGLPTAGVQQLREALTQVQGFIQMHIGDMPSQNLAQAQDILSACQTGCNDLERYLQEVKNLMLAAVAGAG